jgi:hypothetical protein
MILRTSICCLVLYKACKVVRKCRLVLGPYWTLCICYVGLVYVVWSYTMYIYTMYVRCRFVCLVLYIQCMYVCMCKVLGKCRFVVGSYWMLCICYVGLVYVDWCYTMYVRCRFVLGSYRVVHKDLSQFVKTLNTRKWMLHRGYYRWYRWYYKIKNDYYIVRQLQIHLGLILNIMYMLLRTGICCLVLYNVCKVQIRLGLILSGTQRFVTAF